MNPLVSVIIPFYRNRNWLEEAVESVVNQTYQNTEIIIINDGSFEDISILIKKYKNTIKYIYQENKGAAIARNVGIKNSIGEYIAFLDSDDIWELSKIEKQVEYMRKENLIWSHTGYNKFYVDRESLKVVASEYIGNIFPISIVSSPIATPCVMIRGDIIRNNEELRFYDGMKSGEDTYLWMKLSKEYYVGYIDEPLTNVRIRGNNAALVAYEQLRARAEIWRIIRIYNKKYIKEINVKLKFAFNLCEAYYNILNNFEGTIIHKMGILEIISKIIYVLPWLIFKYEKYLFFKKGN